MTALHKMLSVLDSGWMKQRHGFAPDDDLKNVTLGEPFEPFVLTDEAIKDYKEGEPLTKILQPTGKLYFPVVSKGKTACWLTLYKNNAGTWSADSLGMADWARVWAGVCTDWPSGKGYSPIFIIMPRQQRFFFTVPQQTPQNLTPLSRPVADAAPQSYKNLQSARATFSELRGQQNPQR
ncbi:MAG: hypothetical protein ACXWKG_08980 [Limisphaerales bacterium]